MPSGRYKLLDAYANRQVWFHRDEDRPQDWVIEEVEDCEPYVEAARRLSALRPGREFRHVAVVPHFVAARAMRERWEPADWRRWLNHPDNRAFRTWPGTL